MSFSLSVYLDFTGFFIKQFLIPNSPFNHPDSVQVTEVTLFPIGEKYFGKPHSDFLALKMQKKCSAR